VSLVRHVLFAGRKKVRKEGLAPSVLNSNLKPWLRVQTFSCLFSIIKTASFIAVVPGRLLNERKLLMAVFVLNVTCASVT
jgi:hypothetical protein